MIGASMEDDESNEAPSLPEDYLTLAQLQERWLKEQERKQNQEREMEQKLEREKAERDRKKREEEEDDRTLNGTTEEVAESSTHRRYRHRPKALEFQTQPPVAVVDDGARMADESRQEQQKKKKKNKNKKKLSWKEMREKRNESRASKTGAGETPAVQTEGEVEKVVAEKTQELVQPEAEVERVVVNKTQVEQKFMDLSVNKGDKSKIRINGNWSHLKGNQWVVKDKVLGDYMASPIEQNFEGLSVNGGKKGNGRSLEGRNRRDEEYRRGSGRFNVRSQRLQGRKDGNFIWVKKGEPTDAGASGVQC